MDSTPTPTKLAGETSASEADTQVPRKLMSSSGAAVLTPNELMADSMMSPSPPQDDVLKTPCLLDATTEFKQLKV